MTERPVEHRTGERSNVGYAYLHNSGLNPMGVPRTGRAQRLPLGHGPAWAKV